MHVDYYSVGALSGWQHFGNVFLYIHAQSVPAVVVGKEGRA